MGILIMIGRDVVHMYICSIACKYTSIYVYISIRTGTEMSICTYRGHIGPMLIDGD